MSATAKHLVRHDAEMVVAMFLGMAGVMRMRPSEYAHHGHHVGAEPAVAERVTA